MLALARNLCAVVLAADVIGYADGTWLTWLDTVRTQVITVSRAGITNLRDSALKDPTNHGCMARASYYAACRYITDAAGMAECESVFREYLAGTEWAGSVWNSSDATWQTDGVGHRHGVTPAGTLISGHDVSGALPEEMRRGGTFAWPPTYTGYAWEAMQGTVTCAELMFRAGESDIYTHGTNAVLRAAQFIYSLVPYSASWTPTGDDNWQPWLLNYRTALGAAATTPTQRGKNLGYTDWVYAAGPPAGRQHPFADVLLSGG